MVLNKNILCITFLKLNEPHKNRGILITQMFFGDLFFGEFFDDLTTITLFLLNLARQRTKICPIFRQFASYKLEKNIYSYSTVLHLTHRIIKHLSSKKESSPFKGISCKENPLPN